MTREPITAQNEKSHIIRLGNTFDGRIVNRIAAHQPKHKCLVVADVPIGLALESDHCEAAKHIPACLCDKALTHTLIAATAMLYHINNAPLFGATHGHNVLLAVNGGVACFDIDLIARSLEQHIKRVCKHRVSKCHSQHAHYSHQPCCETVSKSFLNQQIN